MTTFYFIRHGNAYDQNGEQTPTSKLNSEGASQAENLGKALDGVKFDVILASPWQRAQETCHLATKNTGQPVTTLDILTEVGNGNWPSPQESRGISSNDQLNDYINARDLVRRSWLKLVRDYKGKKVLAFTHGNWIRMLLANILDLSTTNFQTFKIDFASITAIEVDEAENPTILTVSCSVAAIAKKLLE